MNKKFLVWTDFPYAISRELTNKFLRSPYNFEEVNSELYIALSFGNVDVFFSNDEYFASRPGRGWDKLFIDGGYPSDAVLNRVTGITLGYNDIEPLINVLYYDVVKVITCLSSDFMNKSLTLSKPKFIPDIKDVIFNNPATIVFWADGSKTVVKCQDDDIYDPEKGLAMAISKKALGNQGNYCNDIKKWLPEEAKNFHKFVERFKGKRKYNPVQKAYDELVAYRDSINPNNEQLNPDRDASLDLDEIIGYLGEALEG